MSSLSGPPIVDNIVEGKRVNSPSWIAFFSNLFNKLNELENGTSTGTGTTGKIPFYRADGTEDNIDLV